MVKPGMMLILYVDDQGIAAKNKADAVELIRRLRSVHGFELTEEGSFHEFLGIKVSTDEITKKMTMTQKGLIQKIISTTNMENCNPNWVPTSPAAR